MNGLAASRPCATTASVGACAPPATSSIVSVVASASTIMIATSSPTTRPATTMSNTARFRSSYWGNATHWPSMKGDAHAADRTAERQARRAGWTPMRR